ncbi:SgcJ/EcaC family oxidoreductase [Streptomyces sp. NPDC006798]|uniref:SgcJ/EcaC family oxidoreductase n=1 Tax=Streptomyces sp. NPDC006798 TaxID=3155462 RepID=UPI0033E0E80E
MSDEVLVVGTVPRRTREAVSAVVKALEGAFNTKDPVALGEQFSTDASWTNAMGARLDGRKAVTEFSAPALKGFLSDSYARYDIVKVLEVAPGVVAVNVVQTPTDAVGGPAGGPWGSALYVIAERPDGWKIVAGQNTAVNTPAA